MYLKWADCYLVMMAKLIPITDAGALCLIVLGRVRKPKKTDRQKPTTSKYYLKAKHLKDVKLSRQK